MEQTWAVARCGVKYLVAFIELEREINALSARTRYALAALIVCVEVAAIFLRALLSLSAVSLSRVCGEGLYSR